MNENPEQRQEPGDQAPHQDSSTEGEHLRSPEPGYPAGETEPAGGVEPGEHEHPEDIGDTTPQQDTTP